jgi:hypothetical protein
MQKTLNIATILFTLAVTIGVLFHDMHIDKATTVALTVPAALASYGIAHMIGGSEHTHVERVSFAHQSSIYHSSLPKVTPRDKNNMYIKVKQSLANSGDSPILWPSV